jgi:hypothetical protein
MVETNKSLGRRTVATTAASSLVMEDIDAVFITRGSMRLSIQGATLVCEYSLQSLPAVFLAGQCSQPLMLWMVPN